jgi:hypothetical protein
MIYSTDLVISKKINSLKTGLENRIPSDQKIQKGKNRGQKRKNKKFNVSRAGNSCWRAGGFSWSPGVLHVVQI